MKVGIIGGEGFIGKNFKNYLISNGIQPTSIKNRNFNIERLKKELLNTDVIYDFSVSWSGELVDQVVNNSFNPFLTASLLNKKKFIWISTSAINSQTTYGISKLIGEKVLMKLKNTTIVRISDVYGLSQKTDREIIFKPSARRIQRFVAAYKSIKEGKTEWIPMHGFTKERGKIIHRIDDDFLYPTYIEDVTKMLFRLRKPGLVEFYGPRISNYQLVKTIQEYYKIKIGIEVNKSKTNNIDLISTRGLTTFKEGINKWLSE